MAELQFYADGEWFSVEATDDRQDATRVLLASSARARSGVLIPLAGYPTLLREEEKDGEEIAHALQIDTTALSGDVVLLDIDRFLKRAAEVLKDKKATASLTPANLHEWGGAP